MTVPCILCGRRFGGHESWVRHFVPRTDRTRCLSERILLEKNRYIRDREGVWHRNPSALLSAPVGAVADSDAKNGSQLALDGMAQANAAASQAWKDRWRAAIAELASLGEPFTSENARERAGDPLDHDNAIGALFHTAARAGLIRRVGFQQSTRPERHANVLRVWVGA